LLAQTCREKGVAGLAPLAAGSRAHAGGSPERRQAVGGSANLLDVRGLGRRCHRRGRRTKGGATLVYPEAPGRPSCGDGEHARSDREGRRRSGEVWRWEVGGDQGARGGGREARDGRGACGGGRGECGSRGSAPAQETGHGRLRRRCGVATGSTDKTRPPVEDGSGCIRAGIRIRTHGRRLVRTDRWCFTFFSPNRSVL
jgi:hypothetical protein